MKNLFLFTGEETFLLNEQVKAWKQAFLEKHGDLNLIHLNGLELSVAELQAQIEAAPFLGERRLIFIDDLPFATTKTQSESKKEAQKEQEEKLITLFDKVSEASVVVLIQPRPDKRKKLYKKIVQQAQIKEFNPLSEGELSQWIKRRFQQSEKEIDLSDANYLVSLTGANLWRLSQEVSKLIDVSSKKISRQQIDQLVTPSVEANIFHFTDALGGRSPKQAIRCLHRSIESGDSMTQLFYMVIRQFRLFLQVKGYQNQFPSADQRQLASQLKLHPFVVKNITRQVRFFDINKLKEAYSKLLEIDHQLKTSRIKISTEDQAELSLAIEKFILRFCV